jgi:ureidoacrylate peracid hydrolase
MRKPTMLIPGETVLVVVDMQNGFCHPQGSMARLGLDVTGLTAAIEPCVRVLAWAREAGIPVIHTRMQYRPDYADGGLSISQMMPEMVPMASLAAGTWDTDNVAELQPIAGETVIGKNRFSAFYAPEFEATLQRLGIRSLIVCGVTTNCCVEATVRDAFQRDYETVVVKDAVGELEQVRHDSALRTMGFLFSDLLTSEEVKARWDESALPAAANG